MGHAQKELLPPWTLGHAQTSLISALISPTSCNVTGLALLDHSLVCIPCCGANCYSTAKKKKKQPKNIYFMLNACSDGFSQDATSYDLHLDTVHVLCNQAESRKVICNEGIVSIYRMH